MRYCWPLKSVFHFMASSDVYRWQYTRGLSLHLFVYCRQDKKQLWGSSFSFPETLKPQLMNLAKVHSLDCKSEKSLLHAFVGFRFKKGKDYDKSKKKVHLDLHDTLDDFGPCRLNGDAPGMFTGRLPIKCAYSIIP